GPFERHFEGDLGAGQREQREIQAAPPQDDGAHRQRQQDREHSGRQQEFDLVAAGIGAGADGHCVARAAEEEGSAEGHQAQVADQKVHAAAVQGVDGDLRDRVDGHAHRVGDARDADQHCRDHRDRMFPETLRLHSKRSQRSPNRPRGRSSMTRNMKAYMDAAAASGLNWMVSDMTTPTARPATTAPPNDPRPPIATTTKAGMIALAAIDGDTAHKGAARTPAIAASAQPSPNTAVCTRGRFTPSISTISGSRL